MLGGEEWGKKIVAVEPARKNSRAPELVTICYRSFSAAHCVMIVMGGAEHEGKELINKRPSPATSY
jgi:hypothetical protein